MTKAELAWQLKCTQALAEARADLNASLERELEQAQITIARYERLYAQEHPQEVADLGGLSPLVTH